jgi:hypothetical protein
MIKKFEDYCESFWPSGFPKTGIFSVLPLEEVEDQFLRLKEVFNCDIKIYRHCVTNSKSVVTRGIIEWPRVYDDKSRLVDTGTKWIANIIITSFDKSKTKMREILDEFDQIKNRLESIYPIKIHFNPIDDRYDPPRFEAFIDLK